MSLLLHYLGQVGEMKMKDFFMLTLYFIPVVTCFCGAIYYAKDSIGIAILFIIVAILIYPKYRKIDICENCGHKIGEKILGKEGISSMWECKKDKNKE